MRRQAGLPKPRAERPADPAGGAGLCGGTDGGAERQWPEESPEFAVFGHLGGMPRRRGFPWSKLTTSDYLTFSSGPDSRATLQALLN